MSKLSRIFYIYGNASMAVAMAIAAVLELLCGLVLGGAFATLCYSAAALFAVVAFTLSYRVYRSAKSNNLI